MATEAANLVLGKVVDLLFSAAKRELDYMRNYTENVGKLRNEAEKLRHLRGRVQQRIDIAKTEGEDLLDGVQEWVVKADAEICMAEEFLEQEAHANKTCFNLRLCVNLGTLHRYSKMATKKTPSVLQLHENGTTYESCVSLPAPTLGFLKLYERKNLEDLETQKLTLEKIMEAIKDESKQIIGIYGLGGVGKTTLAKEVAAAAKSLFADVVFTTISQTVNAEKIQKDVEKAGKRIMKGDKILIILDDVWGKLELEEVGIPCGSSYMNCKILLTSRSRDVCEAMDAQSTICLDPLLEEEAWLLFKGEAGARVETDAELNPTARAVAEECGGLPLLIQAVGKALKNKTNDFWVAALKQLKNHDPREINPEIRKAFLRLELSYNCLESEEAKSCFLLCSMFPEDSQIPVERLMLYGVGLGKFKRLSSLEDARDRVRFAVSTLKSSFLLLDGRNNLEAKMHDVVRDVALLIASEGQNNFLVEAGIGLTEWRLDRDASRNYTAVSLMRNDIRKLPDGLDCPNLDTLLLQDNRFLSTVPDEFIRGVKEVKVLDLEYNDISSLPQSLAQLTKLRMLNLGGNEQLKEIYVLGELKGLEILILDNTGIEEIPQQIGQLSYLRLLDVRECDDLSHIAPGVISKLQGLENLYIGYNSLQWDNYNILVELSNLSRLTVLDLWVPDVDVIPEDVHFETFKEFTIQIEGHEGASEFLWEQNLESRLILATPYLKIPLLGGIEKLIQVTQFLLVKSIENLNNILPSLNNEDLAKLKHLVVESCENISCLVDTRDWDQRQAFYSLERLMISGSDNLSEICRGHLLDESFSKLHDIYVGDCSSLESIVSSSMPHVLRNITKVKVEVCTSVSCIFECKGIGGRKGEENFLSKLEVLILLELPELEVIWNCPDQMISLSNLVDIEISGCKLTRFCSVSVARGLVQLQRLVIRSCKGMKEVIGGGEEERVGGREIGEVAAANIIEFRWLQMIRIVHLPKLKSFWSGYDTIVYPSLVHVEIVGCDSLEVWGYGIQDTRELEYVGTGFRKGDHPLGRDLNEFVRTHHFQ